MTITEIGAREDHEGVWHAVTDDESRSAVTTALCGTEIPHGAPTGSWDDLDESAATCADRREMVEGEHRETGFSIENVGGVPAIRFRDDPPMVSGSLPSPAPAAQALLSSSRLTRSSWRRWPQRKLRRKVPRVDATLTAKSSTRSVPPDRSAELRDLNAPRAPDP